ncbi:MAG TPA: 23S rRNA (adenine(2503)-C(2))-methyltransferase RlmN [Actinomycetota bacterium]|nr:23S rRNA (adenine(2503)-C(2))-methyltransferase RlmN [Actinomycetota bacterium]
MTVYDLDLDGLSERMTSWGEPAFRARQVYAQLWRRSATYGEMTDVSARLRERLETELPLEVEQLDERTADRGATRKVLLRLGGRHVIETVLMGYRDRVTACVSSQSGCAMGCSFCATGQMGLLNNLSAGEIAAQVVWARRAASRLPASTPQRITNVVFMGMGEPFANERPVLGALARLTDPNGMRLGSRHITISTVGIVPGIRRLPDANDQVRLAVSFHAADDDLRNELVPANRLWPLDALVGAIAGWRERTHHRPSIEWAMIDGVNDSEDQAHKLAPIAFGLHAHVNLIPLNPTAGSTARPSPPGRIAAFADVLERAHVNVTVRDTRGRGIEAACGQLRWEHDRAPAAV